MSNPVVVSLLWPKNQVVSVELARRFPVDVASSANIVPAAHREAIAGAGRRCITLGEAPYEVDEERLRSDVDERFRALQEPLWRHVISIAGAQRGQKVAQAMTKAISQRIYGAALMIEMLEALREREEVAGLVVNESEAAFGKTAALWARSHGIPTFLLSHGSGIGEVYTITRDFVADDLIFAGERGAEPYGDLGFSREHMMIGGNPAWDNASVLAARKSEIRSQVFTSLDIDPSLPLVIFATTWNAHLTALQDAGVYEQTVRAFLAACRIAREAGLRFHAIVKDRPPNAKLGSAETTRIGNEVGFTDFRYATGDMMSMLLAADLLVGYDSSSFVEAMIAGIPSINVWTPSSWLVGPALSQSDGIPMVQYDRPEGLAELLAMLLGNASLRSEVSAGIASHLERFAYKTDGLSAARCANAVGTLLRLGQRNPV